MTKKEISKYSIPFVLFLVVLVCLYLLNIVSVPEAINLLLLFTLIYVTAIYAKRTAEIANANEKMAEEMREQRYDTVRPILDVSRNGSDERRLSEIIAAENEDLSYGLSCILHNVGLGPAIDTYSLVQHSEAERSLDYLGTIVKEGETGSYNLSIQQEDERIALVVRYKDVYGREFESSREVSFVKETGAWILNPLEIVIVKEIIE